MLWILCQMTKMILHAARTNWAKSSQFKFQHGRFFFAFWVTIVNWFKIHKVPILPSLLVKVRKPFQSSSFRQVRNSCSVQKWFKVHKVRILPSLWVKVHKSFVCCQINLSVKLAIQVSEGTHCTFNFRSKLQNPQIITQNDNYKKWVIWGWLTPRTLHFCNCRCYGGDRRRLIFYSRAGLHWPYKVSLWLVIIKLSVILNPTRWIFDTHINKFGHINACSLNRENYITCRQ